MATNNKRLTPFKPTHPGEILREELRERGIRQKDFAEQIGMQATHLPIFQLPHPSHNRHRQKITHQRHANRRHRRSHRTYS